MEVGTILGGVITATETVTEVIMVMAMVTITAMEAAGDTMAEAMARSDAMLSPETGIPFPTTSVISFQTSEADILAAVGLQLVAVVHGQVLRSRP